MRPIWQFLLKHPWCCALAALALVLVLPVLPPVVVWLCRGVLLVLGAVVACGLRGAAREPKRLVFGAVAMALGLVVAYGMVELASWVYVRRVPVTGDPFALTERQRRAAQSIVDGVEGYEVYSPTLAWTIGASKVSKDDLYRSNAGGFRANREYEHKKPAGKIRVLCFGDSYTHCDEVSNSETWTHQAELADANMEFLNFGVPGFGVTQSYLRYKEVADRYETDYVIIGCMTEDTKRSVNVYYPFRYANPEDSPNACALPYAALDPMGNLKVNPPYITSRQGYAAFLEDPLPLLKSMAKADILLRPQPATPFLALLADRSESLEPAMDHVLASCSRVFRGEGKFRSLREREASRNGSRRRRITEINQRLFHRFAKEVERRGAVPLIVWFPSPVNLDHQNEGRTREYAPYFEFFAKENLKAVDTMDWLEEIAGKGKPLPIEGLLEQVHLSAPANAHIGRRMAQFIKAMENERSK